MPVTCKAKSMINEKVTKNPNGTVNLQALVKTIKIVILQL